MGLGTLEAAKLLKNKSYSAERKSVPGSRDHPGGIYIDVNGLAGGSNLGINIEEGFHAIPQLSLNLLLAAFQHVHGDPRCMSVLQFHGSVAYRFDFVGRQEAHAVYESEICHASSLASREVETQHAAG